MGPEIRNPVVAGQFYPKAPKELTGLIKGLVDKKAKKRDYLACLLPHAGYIYSGAVAVATVSRINIKENIILLGPNHTGLGSSFSIMAEGVWKTPLGTVKVNTLLSQAILKQAQVLKNDPLAHREEHSLEVELPILQYFRKDFSIVPIAFLTNEVESLKTVGRKIAAAVDDLRLKENTLLVASSDLTHYEPKAQAEKKDREAIEAILALDEDGLARRVQQFDISMCGYAPAIAMISFAKAQGAKGAELVKYETSGDITQDYSSVVGYAGIVIY